MASHLQAEPKPVYILVLDQEGPSATALRQVLDSEGWRVRVIGDAGQLLPELKTAQWSLVIANIGLLGVESAGYLTLRELAGVPAEQGGRVRGPSRAPGVAGGQLGGPV